MHEVIINRDWCKGCNICVAFCPKNVLVLDEKEKAIVQRPELCIGCRLCEHLCPDLAVTVHTDVPPQGEGEGQLQMEKVN